uniref:BED-type domain-containing protein n=1 Tax=Trichuris muris TaxID=70415 RepID=A0A5S6QZ82_TRIMR
MSSAAKKKCRRYSVEYLKYGFVPAAHDHLLPLCFICKATFSNENMKPCKMKKHLTEVERYFPETDDTDAYGSRKATEIRQRHCCVVLSIIISDVMKLAPEETVQAIPLSNSTVCRRIDEIAVG